jgi:hypothetical protein
LFIFIVSGRLILNIQLESKVSILSIKYFLRHLIINAQLEN